MTRLFVSKRRSRAAHDDSRVIPAQAGIQGFSWGCGSCLPRKATGFPPARERHETEGRGAVIPVSRSEDRDPVSATELGRGLRRGDGSFERFIAAVTGFPLPGERCLRGDEK